MSELKQIQKMLTEILKVFHDFCVEHSLQYYALGGTALGAARHQGFIPWDDDIDVGMPRPDYERFIELFNKKNTSNRYILETPYSADPHFPYPYSKIYDTQTTLIENLRYPIKRGIFLDVFPLDGAGKDVDEAKKIVKKIMFLSTVRKMIVCAPSFKRGIRRNALLILAKPLATVLGLKIKTLRLKIDRESQKEDYKSSILISNFLGQSGMKGLLPKEYWGTPTLLQFENIKIFCPEQIDHYLISLYGDWRTPPPKEKQITHHDYTLDLNKPFLEENDIKNSHFFTS